MVSVGLQLLILVCTAAAAVLLTRQRYVKNIEQLQMTIGQGEYENQRLLQEIDQRLKDNMQTVISLTNLEYRRTQKTAAPSNDALKNLQGRFNAMAIIQRALSERATATTIAARPMITDLIKQHTNSAANPIETAIETHDLELDVLLAGPLGMIIHEVCKQAVKANGGEPGFLICVELNETGQSQTLDLHAFNKEEKKAHLSQTEEPLGDAIIEMMCEQIAGDMDRFAEPSHVTWALGFPRVRPDIALH